MTPAERQRRYRERRAAGEPVRTVVRPKDRRPRPKRWADAVDQLRTLQAEYEAWRDQLPESLADSRTAELLEGVCDVPFQDDLETLPITPLKVNNWPAWPTASSRSSSQAGARTGPAAHGP